MEKEKDTERELKKLYVGGLPADYKNDELEELFESYGKIKNAFVVPGKFFGFVEFETEEEAEKAKDKLDGAEIGDKCLMVNFAKPKKR